MNPFVLNNLMSLFAYLERGFDNMVYECWIWFLKYFAIKRDTILNIIQQVHAHRNVLYWLMLSFLATIMMAPFCNGPLQQEYIFWNIIALCDFKINKITI